MKAIKEQQQPLEAEFATWSERVQELLDRVPNPPRRHAGRRQEEDAVEEKKVGEPPSFDFEPKDHLELSAPHGWIDVERGAKVSGSRFVYRVGEVALLETALYRWALARIVAKGHVPVLPPVLVREEAMYGTGFFPSEKGDFYSSPTTTSISSAPRRSRSPRSTWARSSKACRCAMSRSRPASAARQARPAATRAACSGPSVRQVEMFVFCDPSTSRDEHERLLDIERSSCRSSSCPIAY